MRGCRHRASSSTAAAAADDLSFGRFYDKECNSKQIEIPEAFVSSFLRRGPENFRLESAQGNWNVVTRNDGQSVFFSGGWPAFVEGNTLLTGDFLVFHYVGGSHFEVGVFGLHACRKDADMTQTSGSRASIWASSFKSLATNEGGAGGGVSPIKSPTKDLQSSSEKEGSGGYGGAARRRGRLFSDLADGASDYGSRGGRGRFGRSMIPPRKRGRRLSSSSGDDSSSDGLNTGTKFLPHPRAKNHGNASDEEEDQGYYNGGARRASLSGSEDNSMHDGYTKSLSEAPPPRPSRGTVRSNKASQTKNRSRGVSARLRPEEELQNSLEEDSSDGGGGAPRIGRASFYCSDDDSSYDGGRGGERRARRKTPPLSHRSGRDGKSGTLRSNKGTSKFPPQPWAEYHSSGGGVSARLRPEEAQGSGAPRWRGRSLSSIDGSSDYGSSNDGSRSRSRTPSLRPSSGRDGGKAGALKSNRVSTKLPPHSRTKSRSNGGGVSTRLRPEDSSDGGGAQQMQSASLSRSEDDISDHGSRGGGKRIPRGSHKHRRLSSSIRNAPIAGLSAKLAPQSLARNHSSSGRPSARFYPKEELLSSSEDEGRGGYGGVARPMRRASHSDYKDDIGDNGSRGGYGGVARPMRRASSEDEGRGGYGGVARPMRRASHSDYKDDIGDNGSRGGYGVARPMGRASTSYYKGDISNGGSRGSYGGVAQPRGRASRSDFKDDIRDDGSRGSYGGVAQPRGRASRSDFKDDIRDDGSRGGGGRRILRRRSHKSGRDGRNAGKSGDDVIIID